MTETSACPVAGGTDQVHRYVAGKLGGQELDGFEAHLLECAACQAAVREGSVLRAALAGGAAGARRRRRLVWLVPAAAAAATAVWWIGPAGDEVRRLGRLDSPPAFGGVPVRAGGDSATVLADAGLSAYGAGRFGEAADLLGAAAALEPSPGTSFFLGAARLFAGDPAGARAALRDAQAPPGNPYAEEAGYLLAKAWLRDGRADSALAALGAVPASSGGAGARAAALADSVRRVLP